MGRKILIVDDSVALRQQLKRDLQNAGHEVHEAVDGIDGLNMIEQVGDADLLLCDVNMPNMDGLAMCEKLVEKNLWHGKPIFMLTTESNQEMKIRGKKAGVVAWILKPYSIENLLLAIERVLNRNKLRKAS